MDIAVTGIGIVSSLGNDMDTLWGNLTEGRSGIIPMDTLHDLPVTFGAPAMGFDPAGYLGKKETRKMDRYALMAVCAAIDACRQAGIEDNVLPTNRVGVIVGTAAGGMATIEQQIDRFSTGGSRHVSPRTIPMFIPNMASAVIARHMGVRGPGMGISTACATGGHAMALASRLIQAGDADCMIAGGVEACLTPFSVSSFASMRALSTRNQDPEHASRPFDRDRDGFVMSEGGAVFVLEGLEHAQKRGAKVLCLIKGVGMSQDAYDMVMPDPKADAVVNAMDAALRDADIKPEKIDYINAHGTSTPLNDKMETFAVKRFFGDHAYKLKISSTKSMTGHPLGGAASLEAAICSLVMSKGIIPPTINLDNPDPQCDLDYVPNQAIQSSVSYCLNNAFGFGGQNVVMVLGRGDE
ncbi:MAG: beta-ketoacyl-ACP synthase II [Thermodesulfobacteriota bacterium]|nr:beta-ketoacyl-ACP synthase II [Thermodesulfobacteriota bacterium]